MEKLRIKESVDYIYSRRKFAKSSGLERVTALLAELGDPQERLKFVHIVGTNGKGSTANMISRCLVEAGYTVGLFTSPFVVDFLERIQVNNEFISGEIFVRSVERVRKAIEKIEPDGFSPTFFEALLASALLCFESAGTDVVVLEAGIGGGNDSTNVIPAPIVSVITSISLDHTEMLGDTIEKIAEEKCGIIKPGTAVVCFPEENGGFDFIPQSREAMDVIRGFCAGLSVPLILPSMSEVTGFENKKGRLSFEYDGLALELPLSGEHQLANACVAVEALRALDEKGFEIKNDHIEKGAAKAVMPCRMERFRHKGKTVILDGGHNPGCMTALKKLLEHDFPSEKVTALMGFMADKDFKTSLEIIAPRVERFVFTLADEARGESPDELAGAAEGLCSEITAEPDAMKAFEKALETEDDVIICAGSFYLASEIRKSLTKSGREDII